MEAQDDNRGTGRSTRTLLRTVIEAMDGNSCVHVSATYRSADEFLSTAAHILDSLGVVCGVNRGEREIRVGIPRTDSQGVIKFAVAGESLRGSRYNFAFQDHYKGERSY